MSDWLTAVVTGALTAAGAGNVTAVVSAPDATGAATEATGASAVVTGAKVEVTGAAIAVTGASAEPAWATAVVTGGVKAGELLAANPGSSAPSDNLI